jgi:DNA-binding XRE family transcriptional regulator
MARSRLKVILAERDITVKELSYMSGVSYGTCSAIVNGRKPQIETAYKIADALGMHINRVFPNYYTYEKIKRKKKGS